MIIPQLPESVQNEIIDLTKQGFSQCAIAYRLKVSRSAVQNAQKRHGVHSSSIGKGGTSSPPPPPFEAPYIPSGELPLPELLDHIERRSLLVQEAHKARRLMNVKVNTPGPIGLMFWGDPHLDDNGCDFVTLRRHVEIASAKHRKRYLFSGNIGDVQNNWIGRLSRLYGKQDTSEKTAWRLVEWLMRDAGIRWLFLIRGNHDEWSGTGDPLNWIMRGSGAVDQPHGARIALGHPCGAETRIHARHDFKGHSQFNDLHGLKKELLWGERDHVVVAGHRHIGGDASDLIGGVSCQLLRVSGYKRVDDYQHQGGFAVKPMHPSALVIIDPSKADNERSRAWCAPSVEEGVEYLDWLRARYEKAAA